MVVIALFIGQMADASPQGLDEYFRSNDTNGFQRVRNHISSTTRSSSGSTFSSLPSTSHPTHLDHNKGGGPSPGSTMNTPNNSYAQCELKIEAHGIV